MDVDMVGVQESTSPSNYPFSDDWANNAETLEKRHEILNSQGETLKRKDKAMFDSLQSEIADINSVHWARFKRHVQLAETKASKPGHKWTSAKEGKGKKGALRETSKEEAATKAKKAGDNAALCDTSVKQHHGYFQISDSLDSDDEEEMQMDNEDGKNYFYWMFEARNQIKNKKNTAPVMMWLTGGPGCSSMLALLSENGPCSVNSDLSTKINKYSWHDKANVIFVDQPAGTGFSYGIDTDTNEKEVSEDLYHFMQEFVKMHPEFKQNDFYIFGESYAGHFVPATAYRIFEGNKDKSDPNLEYIALRGFGVGNGLTDPEIQYQHYPEMAFQQNLKKEDQTAKPAVSQHEYEEMKQAVEPCIKGIKQCQSDDDACADAMSSCNSDLIYPYQKSGMNVYDMRKKCTHPPLCYDFTAVGDYLNSAKVQKVLGVKKQWDTCNFEINGGFKNDWMKNYAANVPEMLKNGQTVLIYTGDEDYICNWLGNKAWTKALDWEHKDKFNAAPDQAWSVDGKQHGDVRSANGLTFLRVFEAGHMVPMDQPKASLAMLNQYLLHQELIVDAATTSSEA